MTSVAIVDCGIGNLHSVYQAFSTAGAEARIVDKPEDIVAADRLVLPGVGAAGIALANIRERGLDAALEQAVRQRARPMMGICLGMQLLAKRLHEFGSHAGLGWIDGDVIHLGSMPGHQGRVPNMGWSDIEIGEGAKRMFASVGRRRQFYFCHSYALSTPSASSIAATVSIGTAVVAAVQFDTVFATQFHPEKSQLGGQSLIRAFLDWTP